MLQQIILITDGCSNVGVSPVVAAARAQAEGIVVNVVGIVDESPMGESGATEIAEIARAGGGMSRIVPSVQLARTMQMMTRKTVSHTIHQVVSRELRQIFGHARLEQLPPAERGQVVEVIDELGESAPLRVALLIDCSASMKPRLAAVKEAIRDLLLSLQARSGKSEISVHHFPGTHERSEDAELDAEWTTELAKINHLFYKLNMKGTTPTGPALLTCIRYILESSGTSPLAGGSDDLVRSQGDGIVRNGEGGLLSDYVV